MAQTLQLFDGVASPNLIDNVAYSAEPTWQPAVSQATLTDLATGQVYEDVEEELSLRIIGATAAAVYQNAQQLAQALHQARDWAAGGFASAVRLRYKPQGSGLSSPLEAAIIDGRLELGVLDDAGMTRVLPATLKLTRRGAWLEQFEVGTVAAAALATVQSVTWPEPGYDYLSPTSISVALSAAFWSATALHVFWGPSTGHTVLEAEATTPLKANTSVVTDTTNRARGNSVLRFSPSVANTPATFAAPALGILPAKRWAVWAALRCSGGVWQVKAGNGVPVTFTSTTPQLVPLGIVSTNPTELSASVAATGSTLDCDYLIVQAADTPAAGVCRIPSVTNGPITIDPRPLDAVGGSVATAGTALSYDGTAIPYSRRTEMLVVAAATMGASWRAASSGGTVPTVTLTVGRNKARLTPQ